MRSARTGGIQGYMNQLAASLCERGHEVTVVCRSHEEAPHAGVRFATLHSLALGAALRTLVFAKDVERHVRRTPYDLVVGLGNTWTQDVIRLGGGCHATYLERAHPHSSRRFGRWLGGISPKHRLILAIEARALAPGAFRCALVNSELVRRDLIERYQVDPEKIRLIRNGVDIERFHPRHRENAGRELRERLGLAGEGPVVLFLGSNYGRKGLDLLLEAFPAFLREFPRAKLLVVGADAGISRWKRRARDLGVDPAVTFLGKRNDPEACYAAADLYALPTRYDSFAFTVLEALASGLPVIVSDAAGAAELVGESCGAVVPWTAGPRELASELSRWASPERRSQAAAAGRRVAEENGSEAAMERTVDLLEELAGGPRSS